MQKTKRSSWLRIRLAPPAKHETDDRPPPNPDFFFHHYVLSRDINLSLLVGTYLSPFSPSCACRQARKAQTPARTADTIQ